MPNLLEIPGKSLVDEMARRARSLAGAAGSGALSVGGSLAKRVLDRSGAGEGGHVRAPSPVPPPIDVPKPAKPKAAKPKADKPKAAKPKPPKPKAKAKPKAAARPKPAAEPGNISGDKEPHHALNNPVSAPDETEYPDPFEKRDDPRDPIDPDGAPFGEEPHPATGSESTSEPPPSQDLEAGDRATPPRRENLDD